MSKDQTPYTEKVSFLITLFCVVIVTQILIGVVLFFSLDTWTDRGTFGDMFGVVNSLFSGLALAGIVYAIFLQRRDLKIQREELELTRIELERSANAQEASSSILSSQLEIMAKDSEFLMQKEIKESEPFFVSNGGNIGRDKGQNRIDIVNTGSKITNLKFEQLSELRVTINNPEVLDTGSSVNMIFNYPPRTTDSLLFRLKYENRLGKEDHKDLIFSPVNNQIKHKNE
tara:strand:+ start:4718 stop:5404 length:687 start_codon:yes stop_codon:yes gene_type:complete